LPILPTASCEKRHSFLNLSYVCAEPVLVKKMILSIKRLKKGAFLTWHGGGNAKRSLQEDGSVLFVQTRFGSGFRAQLLLAGYVPSVV
jgi:hypothetical protein